MFASFWRVWHSVKRGVLPSGLHYLETGIQRNGSSPDTVPSLSKLKLSLIHAPFIISCSPANGFENSRSPSYEC